MATHRSLRLGAARRNTLTACLAVALTAGGAVAGSGSRATDARTPSAPMHPAGNIIPVTSCDDDAPGGLREAFAIAQDGNEINLSGATSCSNISLDSGAIVVTVPNLSVVGPGQDLLTINGNDADRVFFSQHGLTITDLTIANGRAANGLGGCIALFAGDLTLTRSTVTGCSVGDSSNLESLGGGVSVPGNLMMQSSTISNSSVAASGRAYGGGAYVSGTATLFDSMIEGNSATSALDNARGGGLFAQGDVILSRTRVLDNAVTSTDDAALGGGLFTLADVQVGVSTISGNTAHSETAWSRGGGIQSGIPGSPTLIELTVSTLSGNTASANCADCSIMGGGASAFGQIIALYSAIHDNNILLAPSSVGKASGGGLATYVSGSGGSIVLANSTVSGNSAIGGENGGYGRGGGIAAIADSPFIAINSTIAFNDASHFGGGAIGSDAGGAAPQMFSTIVANNQAPFGADLAPIELFTGFTINGSNNLVMEATANITLPLDTLDDDPILLPFAPENGGLTATHALGIGSPAIDAGINENDLTYDQRHCPYVRESNGAADIGAFELQAEPPNHIFGHGFDSGAQTCT